MIQNFKQLIEAVQDKPKKTVAIAAPEGSTVMQLVKKALEEKIAEFILVGDQATITSMAADAGLDLKLVSVVTIAVIVSGSSPSTK